MSTLLKDEFTKEIKVEADPVVGITLLDLDESIEAAYAVDDLVSAIDRCETTMTSLEAISDAVSSVLEDGGLDAQGSMMAQVAIESASVSIGVAIKTASLEDFNAEGGRVAATEYTLETLKDTIATIWAAITKFVGDFVKRIAEFVSQNISTAGRVEKAALSLSKKAEAAKGTPKEAKLKITGAVYRNMSADGKMGNDVIDLATEAVKDLTSESGAVDNIIAMTEVFDEVDLDDEASIKKWYAGIKDSDVLSADGIAKSLVSQGFKELTDDSRFTGENVIYLTKKNTLPGEKMVLVTVRSTEEGMIKSIKAGLEDAKAGLKFDDNYDVDALTKDEVISKADAVAKLAEAVRMSKLDAGKRSKAVKDLLKAGDKITKALKSADASVEKTDGAQAAAGFVKNTSMLAQAMFEPGVSIERQAISTAKSYYKLAKSSLSNLKEEK